MCATVTVAVVRTLPTRAPYPTNASILLEDHKSALGMCIEVESGKGDAAQPYVNDVFEHCVKTVKGALIQQDVPAPIIATSN